MYYGTSQFAPYYYFAIRGGNIFGLRDGVLPGELVEVQIDGPEADRLLGMYGIENRYIRPPYMSIEDSIVYTDARIRAIPNNERKALRDLVKKIGGSTTTLMPLVAALESTGEIVVPNNNDIQHVLALYISRFYPEVGENLPSYLTFGFDDQETSFIPKTTTAPAPSGGPSMGGPGGIFGLVLDGISAIIDAGVQASNNQMIANWLSWYNSQVIGVDGRDIQKEYDRNGPAAALVWLRRLKETSWKDIDSWIRQETQERGINVPDAYLTALSKWDKLETDLMREAGEIPGPQPPPSENSNGSTGNGSNSNGDSSDKMKLPSWLPIAAIVVIGLLLFKK